jgi:hypothetical protein
MKTLAATAMAGAQTTINNQLKAVAEMAMMTATMTIMKTKAMAAVVASWRQLGGGGGGVGGSSLAAAWRQRSIGGGSGSVAMAAAWQLGSIGGGGSAAGSAAAAEWRWQQREVQPK